MTVTRGAMVSSARQQAEEIVAHHERMNLAWHNGWDTASQDRWLGSRGGLVRLVAAAIEWEDASRTIRQEDYPSAEAWRRMEAAEVELVAAVAALTREELNDE